MGDELIEEVPESSVFHGTDSIIFLLNGSYVLNLLHRLAGVERVSLMDLADDVRSVWCLK